METVDRWWAWQQMAAEGRKFQDDKEIITAARESGYRAADVVATLKKKICNSGHSLSVTDPTMGGGFRIVGFIDFEGKGIRVTRYGKKTTDGPNEVVRFTWSDFAKTVIHGIKEIAEAEAFEPGKAKARRSAGKQQKGQEEKTMTMLAKTTETRALTLADYEARIHLYKEQIGTGYIGIGRTLIEAKEAKVVPHGQWETWVTETTGLAPRQAQRCMQAATEIRDGSAMAQLEMSKALLLLSSGLDEEQREEIAAKAVDEGATVKQLKEELRKAKLQVVQETGAATEIRDALRKAEEERERLEQQLRATESAYKIRINDEKEDAYKRGEMAGAADAAKEIRQLRNDLENNRQLRQSLKDQLDGAREVMDKRVTGLQNELNKQKQYAESLRDELEKAKAEPAMPAEFARDREILLAAAEDAEKRAADAEAELEALRAGGAGKPDPVWKILKVATVKFMTDCEMLPMDPAAMIPDKARIMAHVERIEKWTDMMRMALEGVVPAEGAVE